VGRRLGALTVRSGPKFAPPVTKNLLFLDQGGYWILQHDAALALLQAATATG
jgi:hypothetical protein